MQVEWCDLTVPSHSMGLLVGWKRCHSSKSAHLSSYELSMGALNRIVCLQMRMILKRQPRSPKRPKAKARVQDLSHLQLISSALMLMTPQRKRSARYGPLACPVCILCLHEHTLSLLCLVGNRSLIRRLSVARFCQLTPRTVKGHVSQ